MVTSTIEVSTGTTVSSSRPWLLARASEAMLAQIIRRTVRFVFLFLVARQLGPEHFGTYALLLALLETISLMTGEGLADFLARETAKLPALARDLFGKVILVRWMLAAFLGPLGIALLAALKYPAEVERNAAWLFLILFSRGPLSAGQGLFRAVHRMRPLVYVEAVQGAIVLGLGSYFLMRHLNLRAVIYAEVIASFAGAAFTAGFVQRLRAGTSHLKATWKMIWTATGTFNIFPLITNIYDRIDVVLLSVIAGSAAAGLYALPYRALATLQIIPFGLMAAVLPVLASRAPSISDREICLRMGTGLAVLSMFPALILTLLARPLVLSVLGREYAASIPILRLLAWAAIPMFLNYGLNTFLLSRSRERAFLWTSSICAIVNVVLNLILIPRFSYYAAAAVTIMTELLLLVHNLLIIRKIFSFVALPKRLLVTAAILLALAAIGLASNLSFSPLFTVTAACAAFSAYLYFDGSFEAIVSELRAS